MQQKTNNREQMPQEQFQRVQKKIEIPQLQLTKEAMRSKIAHTTLEKTFEERDTLIRLLSGLSTEQPEPGASSTRFEEIISPASINQAMEMQAEAERRKHEEILQSEGDQQSEISQARGKQLDCDGVEQQSSAQDPGAHSQPKQKMLRARNRSTQ